MLSASNLISVFFKLSSDVRLINATIFVILFRAIMETFLYMSLTKGKIIAYMPASFFFYGMLLNIIVIRVLHSLMKNLIDLFNNLFGEYYSSVNTITSMENHKRLAKQIFGSLFVFTALGNGLFHAAGGSKYSSVLMYIKEHFASWFYCGVLVEVLALQASFGLGTRFSYDLTQFSLVVFDQLKYFVLTIRESDILHYSQSNKRYTHVISDETFQLKVNQELRRIYYHHLKIVRFSKVYTDSDRVRFSGGLFQLLGFCYIPILMTCKAHMYQNEMIMVFVIIISVYSLTVILFYNMGQYYEDQISDIYDALYNLEWYTWSSQNKKNYILLLTRIPVTESVVIGFNERVNRNFLIKYVRLSYAFLTFLYQTNVLKF